MPGHPPQRPTPRTTSTWRRFVATVALSTGLSCATACAPLDEDSPPLSPDDWGRSDTIRFLPPTFPDPTGPVAWTFTIEELTGIEFLETDIRVGAVAMIPIRDEPIDDTVELGQFSGGTCAPWISFLPTNNLHFGHMLGHAAGLDHHPDSCNLMAESIGVDRFECSEDPSFEGDQVDTLRAYAWALENLCDEWD